MLINTGVNTEISQTSFRMTEQTEDNICARQSSVSMYNDVTDFNKFCLNAFQNILEQKMSEIKGIFPDLGDEELKLRQEKIRDCYQERVAKLNKKAFWYTKNGNEGGNENDFNSSENDLKMKIKSQVQQQNLLLQQIECLQSLKSIVDDEMKKYHDTNKDICTNIY